ncbi:MAG: CPBP family glutamic-type intramembrane protease [Phycicoccus sp.]
MTDQEQSVDPPGHRPGERAFRPAAWATATIVVGAALVVQWATVGDFPAPLVESAVLVGCHAVLVAPFVAVGVLRSSSRRRALRLLAPAGALYVLYQVALRSDLPVVDGVGWNYDGKLVAIVALLVLASGMTTGRPADAGVTTRLHIGRWPWLLGGYAVLVVPLAFVLGPLVDRSVEETIFQLSMPGLDEELFFRGVLLLLLDRGFGTPWRVYGIRLGWGFVCSTVLFILSHVVLVEGSGQPYLSAPDLDRIVAFAMFCLAVTIVRHATGSVWTSALAHNVTNAVLVPLPVPHLVQTGFVLLAALALARHVSRRAEPDSATTERGQVHR